MKPWVMTTCSSARHCACRGASGEKSQVADSNPALAVAPSRRSARSTWRASTQAVAMPWAFKNVGAEGGGEQLAHGHDARAQPSRSPRWPASDRASCRSSCMKPSKRAPGDMPRRCASSRCRGFDPLEDRRSAAGERGGQQRLEPIGDAGQGRMHHHRRMPPADALAQHPGNVVPIGRSRDAGAAEFEHDPALAGFEHCDCCTDVRLREAAAAGATAASRF